MPAALRQSWTAVRLPPAGADGPEVSVEAVADVEGVGVVVGVDVFELPQAARLPTQASEAALKARVRASRIALFSDCWCSAWSWG
jgi:hypothetical protein